MSLQRHEHQQQEEEDDEQEEEDEELMRLIEQQLEAFEQIQAEVHQVPKASPLPLGLLGNQQGIHQEVHGNQRADQRDQTFLDKHIRHQQRLPSEVSSLLEQLELLESQVTLLQTDAMSSNESSHHADQEMEATDDEEDDLDDQDQVEIEDQVGLNDHQHMTDTNKDDQPTIRTDDFWKIRAQQEALEREHAQVQNHQLRNVFAQQIAIAHEMHRQVVTHVQRNTTLWELCDRLRLLTDLRRRRQSTKQPIQRPLETASQKRCKRLVHRLDFAFHQLPVAFHGYSTTIPDEFLDGWLPYHQLEVRYVKSSSGKDFVELVGSTITCFDADTLTELLWTCFTNKKPGPCVESLTRLLASTDASSDRPAQKQTVNDATVHWEGGFGDTLLGLLDASFETNVLTSRRGNVFVMDAIGHIDLKMHVEHQTHHSSYLSFPSELGFNKTRWYRVDPLVDGRSVIHHVHRVQPQDPSGGCDRWHSNPMESQKPLEMQLLTEVLQRAHSQMSLHCQNMILSQVPDSTRVCGNDWPLQGKEF